MLKEIRNISVRLSEQGEKIDAITSKLSAEDQEPGTWAVVTKKKKKDKADSGPTSEEAVRTQCSKMAVGRSSAWTRTTAILVDVAKENFPALAQRIKSGVNKGVIGNHVTGIRQAKSGCLCIEVRSDQKEIEAVRAEVTRSAGSEMVVRSLQRRRLVELSNLDEWTTKEVSVAVAAFAEEQEDTFRVASIRKLYGGVQTALVSAPTELAEKLVNAGRLKVGMVSCCTRIREDKLRCFRCLANGHMANACKGEDRTGCCRSCGASGHIAAHCSANDAERAAFKAKMSGTSTGGTTS